VKVLVFGASGYIGAATCIALKKNGHSVVGVVRQQRCVELDQNEIEYVQGDISDLKALSSQIDEANVIIDNVLDPQKGFGVNKDLLTIVEASSKKNGKKRQIYTSGCLVYGDQPGKELTEADLPKSTVLKARIDMEQDTIKSNAVDGVVIRPGFVYGGKSKELSGWLTPNAKGEWVMNGNPSKSWAWIHIDDLTRCYVALVEAEASAVRGEIFNCNDATRVTYAEFRTAFAREAGFTGELQKAEMGKDFFSMIMEASTVSSNAKAKKVLGWMPHLGPLPKHYKSLYRAWKAHQTT